MRSPVNTPTATLINPKHPVFFTPSIRSLVRLICQFLCSCIAFRPQYTLKNAFVAVFDDRLIVKSVLSTKETLQVVFADLTRYRHSGCRTLSKSTDLTFSPSGKMVVLYYVLSGWFHIFEKLEMQRYVLICSVYWTVGSGAFCYDRW